MRRATNASTGSASDTTGSTRSEGRPGTQPATGSQPSQMPNTSVSTGAATNTGIEMPATANAMTIRSAASPRLRAAHIPAGMPSANARSIAARPIARLTGKPPAISSPTVKSRNLNEGPKSPCSKPRTYRPNCTWIGWSSP